ncbi:MucB/RseB C-terminal domain-containing protein [Salinispirillum marinum]|uniref:MucB/RseB C-terminal domain-containing protein n=2 Tax=Saccharospirillaceae TaxID=255527 RepID=A0ABV8BH53_9GAMM
MMRRVLGFLLLVGLSAASVGQTRITDVMAWADGWLNSTRSQNYTGVLSISGDSGMYTYRLWHKYTDGQEEERLRRLDGPLLEVVRVGDSVTCLHGPGADVPADHALPASPFAQLLHLEWMRVAEHYAVWSVRTERVAGRPAQLFELRPQHDAEVYRHRLWLDEETEVLLKYQIIGLDDAVLSEARFTDIEFGIVELPPQFGSTFPNSFWHQYRPQSIQSTVDAAQIWQAGYMPEGFTLRVEEARGEGWYQMWSDGVVKLSVMVDPIMNNMPMNTSERRGANALVAQVHGPWQVVLIGAIPERTAQRIATEIEWR